MKHISTILLLLLLSVACISAQKAALKVEVPKEVVEGDSFKVIYTLSGAEAESIDFPEQIKGFDILYGPTPSANYIRDRRGIRYIESINYQYVLEAKREGTFTIPSVTVIAEGKKYKSQSSKIKVISKKALQEKKLKEIENADIFVRPIVNESEIEGKKVFEVTYRLYSTISVSGVTDSEYPDFKDFDILRSWTLGRSMYSGEYKGRKYYFVDLKKYMLLPRKSGKTTVSGGKVEVVFSIETGRVMNSFFGTVPETIEIKKDIDLEAFTIDAGLVGDWSAA